jgi:hypothetical protein
MPAPTPCPTALQYPQPEAILFELIADDVAIMSTYMS